MAEAPAERVERHFAGPAVAADDEQLLARRSVPSRRIAVDATVAHIQAVDDGVPKRAAALDDYIQSSSSVCDEPGPRPTKARVALFIGFGFSHDRRLEIFVLLVFFLFVIIVVRVSRWHLVAPNSAETQSTTSKGT